MHYTRQKRKRIAQKDRSKVNSCCIDESTVDQLISTLKTHIFVRILDTIISKQMTTHIRVEKYVNIIHHHHHHHQKQQQQQQQQQQQGL